MDLLESALLLNMIPEIGPVRFKNLVNHFGELPNIFQSSFTELKSVEGISETLARAILSSGDQRSLLEKELQLTKTEGITILTLEHPAYPSLLKTLLDPPPVLYCKGNAKLLSEASIALVGTRRPTPYGERVAGSLARAFSEMGIPTVSGLARGIDTVVHQSTLQSKGKTVAVLGSGLLKIYPPENKRLAESIAEKGLLLSEFPLQFPPEPGHFPRRNRIIAGVSMGTVVVESDEKSGALITAKLAAEQGKDVFAVPGPITSKMSRGPHQLLRQGAKLVESCQDILEEIEPLKQSVLAQFNKNARPARAAENATPGALSSQESHLLELIHMEPVHIDFLSTQTRLESGELSQALLNLEMKGIVRALSGKMYVRN